MKKKQIEGMFKTYNEFIVHSPEQLKLINELFPQKKPDPIFEDSDFVYTELETGIERRIPWKEFKEFLKWKSKQ
jgi:hypothetical protein